MKKKYPDVFKVYSLKPLNQDIVIFCTEDYQRLADHLNKKKNKPVSDWIKEHNDGKGISLPTDDSGGGVYFNPDEKPLLMFIRQAKRDWSFYGKIMHELVHLTDGIGEYYGCSKESEFRAYMFEQMFHDIRKMLG